MTLSNLPIAIISFNRPSYLAQMLDTLKTQHNGNLENRVIALFQDGAWSHSLQRFKADEKDIKKCIDIFLERFPSGQVFDSEINLGIANNIDRAERFVFETLEAPAGIFFEDDLVLGHSYLTVLQHLIGIALKDERIGYVACFGNHKSSRETQIAHQHLLCPLHLLWGFGLTRQHWLKCRSYIEQYLEFVKGIDYQQRNHEKIRELTKSWGVKPGDTGQDRIKSFVTALVGSIKLNTQVAYASYIGESGENFTPEMFARWGFGKKDHFDEVLTLDFDFSTVNFDPWFTGNNVWKLNSTENIVESDTQSFKNLAFQYRDQRDFVKAEQIFKQGMDKFPNELDQYGHPTFRKEIMRMFLSQQKWIEATALIPNQTDLGGGNWHEILFARAYSDANDITNAKTWWNRIIEREPNNPEAKNFFFQPNTSSNSARAWDMKDISSRPFMEKEGISLLEERLKKIDVFLEYGAGGSTVFAAELGVKNIHSVESDKSFLEAVQKKVASLCPSAKVNPYFVNIGKTGDWGHPTNRESANLWPNYCVAPWQEILKNNQFPDLILIDGRFRVACFLASLLLAKEGTIILFDDYMDRPQYHIIEKYLKPNKTAGRMGEFIVKSDILTSLVLLDLIAYSTNPA